LMPSFVNRANQHVLAEPGSIFYIAEVPPNAGGCGCASASSLSRPPHQV
jgi:hypothetical protein